jgi:hypothetical protein
LTSLSCFLFLLLLLKATLATIRPMPIHTVQAVADQDFGVQKPAQRRINSAVQLVDGEVPDQAAPTVVDLASKYIPNID